MFLKINDTVFNTDIIANIELQKRGIFHILINFKNGNSSLIVSKETKEEAERIYSVICDKLKAESLDAYL